MLLPYLAKTDPEQPAASAECCNDERETQQEADVGGGQAGDVAVTDCAAFLMTISYDHQQNEGVPDQTTDADDGVECRHRRVDRPARIDHGRIGYRVVRHPRRSLENYSKPHNNTIVMSKRLEPQDRGQQRTFHVAVRIALRVIHRQP